MTLAQTGYNNLFLIDFDIVKEHNLLNQAYKRVGTHKITATTEKIKRNLPEALEGSVNILPYDWRAEDYLKDIKAKGNSIVFFAIDTIEGRIACLEQILTDWTEDNKETTYVFVNTSHEVAYVGIFKNQKEDLKNMLLEYKSMDPNDSTDGICGEKSAFYIANIVSGLIVGELRKNKENYREEFIYDIKKNKFIDEFKWFIK